jgi:hypothetical protein
MAGLFLVPAIHRPCVEQPLEGLASQGPPPRRTLRADRVWMAGTKEPGHDGLGVINQKTML